MNRLGSRSILDDYISGFKAQEHIGRPNPRGKPNSAIGQPIRGGMSQPGRGGMRQPSQPSRGGMSLPSRGGMSQPSRGGMSQPSRGGMSQPSGGGMIQPSRGGMSPPSRGGIRGVYTGSHSDGLDNARRSGYSSSAPSRGVPWDSTDKGVDRNYTDSDYLRSISGNIPAAMGSGTSGNESMTYSRENSREMSYNQGQGIAPQSSYGIQSANSDNQFGNTYTRPESSNDRQEDVQNIKLKETADRIQNEIKQAKQNVLQQRIAAGQPVSHHTPPSWELIEEMNKIRKKDDVKETELSKVPKSILEQKIAQAFTNILGGTAAQLPIPPPLPVNANGTASDGRRPDIGGRRDRSPVRSFSLVSTRRDYSPRRRDYSPRRRDYSPRRRDYSPRRRGYSPERRRYSPERRGYSSVRRDYSPVSRDRAIRRRDHSPLRQRRSPVRRERSPLRRDRTPPRRFRSPPGKALTSPKRNRMPVTNKQKAKKIENNTKSQLAENNMKSQLAMIRKRQEKPRGFRYQCEACEEGFFMKCDYNEHVFEHTPVDQAMLKDYNDSPICRVCFAESDLVNTPKHHTSKRHKKAVRVLKMDQLFARPIEGPEGENHIIPMEGFVCQICHFFLKDKDGYDKHCRNMGHRKQVLNHKFANFSKQDLEEYIRTQCAELGVALNEEEMKEILSEDFTPERPAKDKTPKPTKKESQTPAASKTNQKNPSSELAGNKKLKKFKKTRRGRRFGKRNLVQAKRIQMMKKRNRKRKT